MISDCIKTQYPFQSKDTHKTPKPRSFATERDYGEIRKLQLLQEVDTLIERIEANVDLSIPQDVQKIKSDVATFRRDYVSMLQFQEEIIKQQLLSIEKQQTKRSSLHSHQTMLDLKQHGHSL